MTKKQRNRLRKAIKNLQSIAQADFLDLHWSTDHDYYMKKVGRALSKPEVTALSLLLRFGPTPYLSDDDVCKCVAGIPAGKYDWDLVAQCLAGV